VDVEPVSVPWLVELINGFAPQARLAAGEQDAPYPDLAGTDLGRADLIDLAARLWPVFGAESDTARAAALNEILELSELAPRVGPSAVGWTCNPGCALLSGCAATILDVLAEHEWDRLGTCDGHDCDDVYLAESARGARRYCSHTCLNRARVRAYRSRQRRTD
jgi:CGNR zinc finger